MGLGRFAPGRPGRAGRKGWGEGVLYREVGELMLMGVCMDCLGVKWSSMRCLGG